MQTPNVLNHLKVKMVFGRVLSKLSKVLERKEVDALCGVGLGNFVKTKQFLSGAWDYDAMYSYILDNVVIDVEKSVTALRYMSCVNLCEELDIELGKVRYLISKGDLSTWHVDDINGLLEPIIELRRLATIDHEHEYAGPVTCTKKLYITSMED